MGKTLLAGFANRRITPALGSQMAGFDARNGTAAAVHDDLHARALVMDDDQTVVALISLEIIGVDRAFAQDVRARITAATGIPAAHVVVAATHTHCGPVTVRHFFNQSQPLDAQYVAELADRTVEAAVEAFGRRRPAMIRAGMVTAEGIAVNRRSESGEPADRDA